MFQEEILQANAQLLHIMINLTSRIYWVQETNQVIVLIYLSIHPTESFNYQAR